MTRISRLFITLFLVSVVHNAPSQQIACDQIQLTDSDGTFADRFGFSVSISGDTLVTGSNLDDVAGIRDQGSVTIFQRDATRWREVRKLTLQNGALSDNFGHSVSLSGDTLAVGSPFQKIGDNEKQGSVTLFSRNQGGAEQWGQIATLTATDGAADDIFGFSVSLFGDTLAVGAPGDSIITNTKQGSVTLFQRNFGGADNWGELPVKLVSSDGAPFDFFGWSISLSEDTLAVGAYRDSVADQVSQGSVTVFDRNLTGADQWGEVRKITASDGTERDLFGSSVSLSGDTLVIGAEGDNFGAEENIFQGSAYIFGRDQGSTGAWGEIRKIVTADSLPDDRAGAAVATAGDLIAVGARSDDIASNEKQGSVILYSRDEGGIGQWGMLRTITANDGSADDRFGSALALSEDTLVIGAHADDIGTNNRQGSVSLVNLDAPSFQDWITTHFGTATQNPGLEATVWGDLADPDKDGLSNLAEAFYGLDPNLADQPDAITFTTPESFHYRWQPATGCPGVHAHLTWSPDLTTWYRSDESPAPGKTYGRLELNT